VLACLSRRRTNPGFHARSVPGFKSHRGRLRQRRHGTQTGKAAKFKPWCLRVRLPPVPLEQNASAGHWRAQVAVTQQPPERLCRFNSCPAHWRTLDTTARCDAGLAARLSISPTRVRFPSASLIRLGVMLVLQSGSQPGRTNPGIRARSVPGSIPVRVTMNAAKWWNFGRHATLRTSCPLRAWEFESPLGY
jgi:hypothetical protein